MLKELRLTNFCQHESLAVTFTEGLNVIRGANEAGKSTLFVAIAYAYFGARALPLSLEDTVTWGKPASSLKVELAFDHAGQDYTIVRKKSGAELLGPDGLRVSGHSEVTGYIEKLFNVSMAVASSTLIAGQGQLKGSLNGSAVSLIEQLANMALIDQLVDKVQAQLPSGNTKLFEAQLADLADLPLPTANLAPLELAVDAADAAEYAAEDAAEQAQVDYELAKAEADAAAARISAASAAEVRRKMLQHQIDRAVVDQQQQAPTCSEAMTEAQLTAALANQAEQRVTLSRWTQFQQIPGAQTTVNRAAALAQLEDFKVRLAAARRLIREAEIGQATVRAGIITQSACGLCGKDLREVPEVVRVNSAAEAKLAELVAVIEAQTSVVKAFDGGCHAILKLVEQDQAAKLAAAKVSDCVRVDDETLPALLTWVGGAVAGEPDNENYSDRLLKLRRYQGQVMLHQSQITRARQHESDLRTELAQVPVCEVNTLDREAARNAAVKLKDAQAAAGLYSTAKQATAAARHALATASQEFSFALERYDAALARRAELAATLADYGANNQLIKKLRDARPVVANRLWGSVLAAISTYFSSVRGVQSVVTRSDNRFLVNGKPVDAYSGSAKDVLGLVIRVTLQKTFLGAIDFMLADEVASAADANRETTMLGLLSTCGYRQVVLVTHSDLADAFAANIIRI